jgi:hypothetical protein
LSSSPGGGIYNNTSGSPGSRIIITNSTITNNRSNGKGGGIRQDGTGSITVRNSIIAGNLSLETPEDDVSGNFLSDGFNLIEDTVGSSGWTSRDLLKLSPMIAALGNNGGGTFTHALLPGSPAINAGNNMLAIDPLTQQPLSTDQRGYSRFVGNEGGVVDIGAYEANFSIGTVTVAGRVASPQGRGIARARIQLDGGNGHIFFTQTNPFGFYRVTGLLPGTTYTLSVIHKSYAFDSPQIFTADIDRSDLNFIADGLVQ